MRVDGDDLEEAAVDVQADEPALRVNVPDDPVVRWPPHPVLYWGKLPMNNRCKADNVQ